MDEVAAREQILLLDESIMDALCTILCFDAGQSQYADTVVEVLTRQTQYNLFKLNHHNLEVD